MRAVAGVLTCLALLCGLGPGGLSTLHADGSSAPTAPVVGPVVGPVAVLVVEPPSASVSRPLLARVARQAVRASGRSIRDRPFEHARDRVRRGTVPRAALRRFVSARAVMEEGWRAYFAADFDIAHERLQKAREAAHDLLGLQGGALLYADISLRLGATLMRRGALTEAAEALAVARALDPGREVSLADFAPDVVEAYRRAAPSQASRQLHVELATGLDPSSLQVFIDGRDRGPPPLTLEVSNAPHLVVARGPGYRARAHLVSAGSDAARLLLQLEREMTTRPLLSPPPAIAAGQSSEHVSAALTALSSYGGIDAAWLLAGVWRGDQRALISQRCTDVPIRCTRVVEIRYPNDDGLPQAARESWRQVADAPLVGPPIVASDARLWPEPSRRAVEETPRRPIRRCRICRNPWLWAGVGAAVLTTGTALWLTRDRERIPVIVVPPCEFGGCRQP